MHRRTPIQVSSRRGIPPRGRALLFFALPLVFCVDIGDVLANHLTIETKLIPVDLAAEDMFGGAVAIDGDVVVVGAELDDDKGTNSGSAYVLRRASEGWVQEQKLTASDGGAFGFFGSSVAVQGDVLVVGAKSANGTGAAYVFRQTSAGWIEEQKLLASDATSGDSFGRSVSIDGDSIVVGADADKDNGPYTGSAYVFRLTPGGWVQEQKLKASDGEAYDQFGYSVSISEETVVVGALADNEKGFGSGSAYVFQRGAYGWVQWQKLIPVDGGTQDHFGFSVAIDENTIVVGAYLDSDRDYEAGSVYLFRRDGDLWSQEQKVFASDAGYLDRFGASVAIAETEFVAGAYRDTSAKGAYAGSAYIFRSETTGWSQEQKITASDAATDDNFGWAVAISDRRVVVGAPRDDERGEDSGSAYVYEESDGRNQPPVANAGIDTRSECTSPAGAVVTLDGSASTDADSIAGTNDDIVLFEWFEDFGTGYPVLLGTGEILDVTLSLGSHVITLRVTDKAGATATDEVVKTIVDTVPPQISVSINPASLWPPNHRLVDVVASVTATDVCSTPSVVLSSIISDEPDDAPGGGDGNTQGDIQDADYGRADLEFRLRAERDGAGDGRSYTVRYTATDSSGNEAAAEAFVEVPHDKGGKADPVEESVNEEDRGTGVAGLRWRTPRATT